MSTETFWRRCSNCKSEIAFGAKYWICSVSTCQRVRAPMQYCKTDCWDVHNEIENHRDGWAVEKLSPATAAPTPRAVASSSSSSPVAATGRSAGAPKPAAEVTAKTEKTTEADEILVVASRFKEYLAEAHGVRCSDDVLPVLSSHLRKLTAEAIDNARRASRKTLLDRDLPRPPADDDVPALVVVSRLKAWVTARSDMRTSDEVIPVLTAELRRLGGQSAETAKADGRKTVLGRDVPRP